MTDSENEQLRGRLSTWLRRKGRWKRWTPYYESSLLYLTTTEYGRVYTKHGQDYLVCEGEVSKIPYYVSLSLRGDHRVTKQWGPYKFINGFETTQEAEYLKKMFQYPHLTDVAQRKVTDILFDNSIWIELDDEFIEILNRREEALRNG